MEKNVAGVFHPSRGHDTLPRPFLHLEIVKLDHFKKVEKF
jgi:hypothetical protein